MPSELDQMTARMRQEANQMEPSRKAEMARELRRLVDLHYDHLKAEADAKGLEPRLAHELAMFRAASVILIGEQIPPKELEKDIQLETIPFNRPTPSAGKEGFKEYLVWKLFPSIANLDVLSNCLRLYKESIFERSENEKDPDHFIYMMIYSEKYDWQRFILNELK